MKMKKLDLRFSEIHNNIRIMCEGLRSLEECGLKTDLLILMLMDITGLGKNAVSAVVRALPRLEETYCKPVKKQ